MNNQVYRTVHVDLFMYHSAIQSFYAGNHSAVHVSQSQIRHFSGIELALHSQAHVTSSDRLVSTRNTHNKNSQLSSGLSMVVRRQSREKLHRAEHSTNIRTAILLRGIMEGKTC